MSGKRKGSAKRSGVKRTKNEDDSSVHVSMNPAYLSDEFKKQFSQFWRGEISTLTDSRALGIQEPFRCCQLRQFVTDASFLDQLKDELTALELVEKNNDLYKFRQTTELANVRSPHVLALRALLFQQLAGWLRHVTGIQLTDQVDMGCSSYGHTDTLLCHDDELEGRRVAFVLYLVPATWTLQDGGTLDLFDRDDHGQPQAVAKSLVPVFNSLVLFEVTPESFHQVSEVLTPDKVRLSVNGWLHGDSVPRPPPFVERREPASSPGHVPEEMVYSWINPLYLAEETQLSIRQQFEDDSEIQLDDFLLTDKYAAVSAALRQLADWQLRGPANRRRVERCAVPLPAPVADCLRLLQSEAVFLILSQLTGLALHPLGRPQRAQNGGRAANGQAGGSGAAASSSSDDDSDDKDGSTATVRSEVRRWQPGNYTLIHDHDSSLQESALDARLCFNVEDWDDGLGGFTSYIARGEDTELLSVSPSGNSLCLVYRDAETVRFVKYVSSQAASRPPFHDIACTYYE